jgi:hypothetical protein
MSRHSARTLASHLRSVLQKIVSASTRRSVQQSDAHSSLRRRKVLVLRDDGELLVIDAIEYDGKFWLAPEWIPGPEIGCEQPRLLICLDNFQVITTDGRNGAEWELVTPLAKNFLDGRETMEGISVIKKPDIFRRVDRD